MRYVFFAALLQSCFATESEAADDLKVTESVSVYNLESLLAPIPQENGDFDLGGGFGTMTFDPYSQSVLFKGSGNVKHLLSGKSFKNEPFSNKGRSSGIVGVFEVSSRRACFGCAKGIFIVFYAESSKLEESLALLVKGGFHVFLRSHHPSEARYLELWLDYFLQVARYTWGLDYTGKYVKVEIMRGAIVRVSVDATGDKWLADFKGELPENWRRSPFEHITSINARFQTLYFAPETASDGAFLLAAIADVTNIFRARATAAADPHDTQNIFDQLPPDEEILQLAFDLWSTRVYSNCEFALIGRDPHSLIVPTQVEGSAAISLATEHPLEITVNRSGKLVALGYSPAGTKAASRYVVKSDFGEVVRGAQGPFVQLSLGEFQKRADGLEYVWPARKSPFIGLVSSSDGKRLLLIRGIEGEPIDLSLVLAASVFMKNHPEIFDETEKISVSMRDLGREFLQIQAAIRF